MEPIGYAIGVTIGIGMLTKYTMAFLVVGLVAGLLLTKSRKWLGKKEPHLAAVIALIIFLPNLLWQFNHNWPVVNHMQELKETQLTNVQPAFFIGMQFLMLFTASLLWVPGVFALFGKKLKTFRLIGWMFAGLVALLLVLSGKPYYTLGIYPVLIAAGAVWWESTIRGMPSVRYVLPVVVLLFALPIIPYGLPVFNIETMKAYCSWMADNGGLSAPLIWEDGVQRPLPQDYAGHVWMGGICGQSRKALS